MSDDRSVLGSEFADDLLQLVLTLVVITFFVGMALAQLTR